jgi:ferredoxin
MKSVGILYFSAVGSTRIAAELLAELLERGAPPNAGEAPRALAIASIEEEKAQAVVSEAEFLVFCYPTYYLKPAPPMRAFSAALGPCGPAKPCYLLTTCELYSENSARSLAKLLVARGFAVCGSKALRAPGSDVTAVLNARLVPWLYRFGRDFEAGLRAAADEIRAAAGQEPSRPALLPSPRWYTPLTQFLQVVALNHFDAVKHRLRVFSERCTACGLCAAGCPADAITMGANGPLLQTGRCLLCCRCIHACPERAIALGKRLKDNRRIDPALLATLKAQARAALGLSV